MSDYINPANAVTASRFLTLPPFLYFVDNGMVQWATFTLIFCGLLDKLDGLAARVFDCASGFGEMLDAIGDAVCYTFFLVTLAIYGAAPWPAVAAILGAGAANTLMRAAYAKRAGRTTNYHSYAMERLVAFIAYLGAVALNDYEITFYFYACTALVVVVVLHDSKRMLWDPVPA